MSLHQHLNYLVDIAYATSSLRLGVLKRKFFFVQWWINSNENTCHEDTTNLTLGQALYQNSRSLCSATNTPTAHSLDRISQFSQDQVLVEVKELLPVRQGRGGVIGARGRRGNDNVST